MATPDGKITKRDNYLQLRELVNQAYENPSEDKERLFAFIDHELDLMAQRAEKSKKYQKAHRASDDEMSTEIMRILDSAEMPMSVADITAKIDGATAQKVVYRLGKLFKSDAITKETQTVKTDNGSKRVTFYCAAPRMAE